MLRLWFNVFFVRIYSGSLWEIIVHQLQSEIYDNKLEKQLEALSTKLTEKKKIFVSSPNAKI